MSFSSLRSSPLYNLPYHTLAKYLLSLSAMPRNDKKYSVIHHQEAIDILLDRMERARLGQREAWELLMDVPVIVDNQHGFAIGIQSGDEESSFYINIYLPDLQKTVFISNTKSFLFALERMPKRSVHAN